MQFSNECVRAKNYSDYPLFLYKFGSSSKLRPTQSQGRDFVEKFMHVPHTYLYALGETILDDSVKVIILFEVVNLWVSMLKAFAAGGDRTLLHCLRDSAEVPELLLAPSRVWCGKEAEHPNAKWIEL